MRNLVAYGFLAPPVLFIVLCFLGALLTFAWRRLGIMMVLGSSFCLFVAATPAFSSYVTQQLESEIPGVPPGKSAQAIVVFGADVQSTDDGDMPERLGPLSLERLVSTADAYQRLHLPVAVSGGRVAHTQTAVAELMKAALERYFAIPVTWSETESQTTYENALYTARLLQAQGISSVILITQARDLPRAIWSFDRAGMTALPWSAPRTPLRVDEIEDFLPNIGALLNSFYAFHELMGSVYYRLRY